MLRSSSRNSGPRGKPGSRGNHSSRGGIAKSRSPAPRLDKDGDIDMGSGSRGRGRGARSGRGNVASTSHSNQQNDRRRSGRPSRNPFDNVAKVQQAIAKGIDSGDTVVRKGGKAKQPREHIHVRGWDKSKAASNPGGCINLLKEFIERKAARQGDKSHPIRLTSTTVSGDTLILHLSPEDAEVVLHLNGFSFAGAPLIIEKKEKDHNKRSPSPAKKDKGSNDGGMTGQELKDRMKSMLDRRYNPDLKLLDLSALGTDPEFVNSGILSTKERQSKFVAALMKVASDVFKTTAQKRETIQSISLARNNLPDVSAVTSVAQTFPDILNLDLSYNDFKSTNALRAWSRRFRSLDILILSNNPIETLQPKYHEDIVRWFRTLRTLNDVSVRTEEQAAASRQRVRLPPVIQPQNFNDTGNIGENFVKYFFPLFDTDRATLVRQFYDSQSTFSLNVNTKAPHSDEFKPAPWGDYIKKSRNLVKITTLPARMARKFTGTAKIGQAWLELPTTKHPDLINEGHRYCIESEIIPHVPDHTGQFPQGVQGLMLIIHGQYGELDISTGQITAMRSFDRTFVLGPGGGLGGIRVVSDICTIRSYGGYDAWIPSQVAQAMEPGQSVPQNQATIQQAQSVTKPATEPTPGLPAGFAQPEPGKSDEQLQKEVLTLQFSQATRLTLTYAVMCLEAAEWNAEKAMGSFEQVKATLPAEAFV